jgi:hypothetical protein
VTDRFLGCRISDEDRKRHLVVVEYSLPLYEFDGNAFQLWLSLLAALRHGDETRQADLKLLPLCGHDCPLGLHNFVASSSILSWKKTEEVASRGTS